MKELWVSEAPVGLHVFWEERLLQGLGYMTCMPPTVMPEGGIPGNGCTIHLQLKRPSASWMAHLSHRKLLSAVNRVGSPSSLVLCLPMLFTPFERAYLTFLRSFYIFFPPQIKVRQESGRMSTCLLLPRPLI